MSGSRFLKILISLVLLFSLRLISCQKDPTSISEPVQQGSWVTYSVYKWSHDGKPYPSEYCIVYSDGATEELKKKVAEFTDQKFIEIMQLFDFEDIEYFRYPPGYNKIDVYINRYHEENIAAAYWGSIFITIRSADVNINRYDYLFRHELTHAFEFLIEGMVNLGTDVWFREGIAIYGGGGLNGITDLDDLENWIAQNSNDPKKGNPIQVHVWNDFPAGADVTGYYYTVFDLTIRYFLDPNGLGKSPGDVLDLFYNLRNGIQFPVALQNNFDLNLQEFENDYYDYMRAYLTSAE